MYNQTVVTPKGQCTVPLTNLKNGKHYKAAFMVLVQEYTPLLGSETIQDMELITVQFENILSVNGSTCREKMSFMTEEDLQKVFSDVFHCTGKLDGKYHLEINNNDNAVAVVHPPMQGSISLEAPIKS